MLSEKIIVRKYKFSVKPVFQKFLPSSRQFEDHDQKCLTSSAGHVALLAIVYLPIYHVGSI